MSTERYRKLVDLLYEKTMRKQVGWQASFNDDEFQARFGPITVEISLLERRGGGQIDIVVKILNENGAVVDTFTDVTIDDSPLTTDYFTKMKNLYDTVQRQVSGADEILDNLLSVLSK